MECTPHSLDRDQNQEPKKSPEAKKSHEQHQRIFWTIRGGYRSLPNKTRVLRQIAPESSPESSAKSLSQKFFGGYLFCPWQKCTENCGQEYSTNLPSARKRLQMKIWRFFFAFAFVMERQICSTRFSFAFAFAMVMLGTHKPQQQATLTN